MSIPWQRTTEVYTNSDNSYFPCVMFGNSQTWQFGYAVETGVLVQTPFAWRQWHRVDCSVFGVSEDAKWVEIDGISIITGAAQLTFAFRSSSSSVVQDWGWYQGQLLSTAPSDGERSSETDTIPLNDCGFEYCINSKEYPDLGVDLGPGSAASVGWNFKLKKWGR